MVEVLDEELGIVSGKKLEPLEGPGLGTDPYYHLYDDQSLLIFTKSYRTWGPFWHRSDLVRLTITVRKRNETQLVVRASAQYYLRAVEDPAPYQKFFRTLEQALFLQGQFWIELTPTTPPASHEGARGDQVLSGAELLFTQQMLQRRNPGRHFRQHNIDLLAQFLQPAAQPRIPSLNSGSLLRPPNHSTLHPLPWNDPLD